MQSVCKFNDNNTDILRHSDEYLTEIFRLFLFLRFKNDLIEFGHARNERQNFLAEFFTDILRGIRRIFDHVVQQRARDRSGVESKFNEYLRYGARMNKIRFSRGALLIGVRLSGKIVGAQQHFASVARIVIVNFHQKSVHNPSLFRQQLYNRAVDFRMIEIGLFPFDQRNFSVFKRNES